MAEEMERTPIGTVDELARAGVLAGKVGSQPVCVFWCDGEPAAVDDRCPHMGFPLHRGKVEEGLLTCLWHNARFDLASGGTLDPFADDVHAHGVEIEDNQVYVVLRGNADPVTHHLRRLEEGLEHGLTLVSAKAVLALLELMGEDEGTTAVLRAGAEFGLRNREAGWGTGLTVLVAMANVLPHLEPHARALALVHGLAFVSEDTRGRAPWFALAPLSAEIEPTRLETWYRRFVDTRNGDACERVLATAIAEKSDPEMMSALMGGAITDHLFVDGGHTVDFTNKAFELLEHLGWQDAISVLPALAHGTATSSRSEESGQWRHPFDLVSLLAPTQSLDSLPTEARADSVFSDQEVDALAWEVLAEEPATVVTALDAARAAGADDEQLARAVAYAAALRLVRFHTQNDHSDWDVVHHGFTAANATHQMVRRSPTPVVARGIYQVAMKVFLDRFLNIPAARPPSSHARSTAPELGELEQCWEREGMVEEAGAIVYGFLSAGGDQRAVVAALGAALLAEDVEFHWYQVYEAAVRQSEAWPENSEQAAMILTGAARFLAAHTPTRRELAQVVRIATRLRRGEALYEEM
ncbi:MAG TPA: Rieske (2Fe-2S) protein [Acidimicrobiales bacterium]